MALFVSKAEDPSLAAGSMVFHTRFNVTKNRYLMLLNIDI